MKSYDKTLTRLIIILTKLSNNDLPTLTELSQEFDVGIRTIQRDLYQRLQYFPIEKNSLGQLLFIDGFSLKRSNLQDDEMLLIYLTMSQVKGITNELTSNIDSIFSKLLSPSFTTPYFIKEKSYEAIDLESNLLKTIKKSIEENRLVKIKTKYISSIIKPYKVVNLRGIWYLLARDMEDEKIKNYLLSHINEVTCKNEFFKLEIDITEVLKNVHSGWFEDGNLFDVTVEVNSKISHYFKLRKVISTQEIIKENKNGTLVLKFQVSSDEDIDNIIKAWLPDIKVITPIRYRDKLYLELKNYLKKSM